MEHLTTAQIKEQVHAGDRAKVASLTAEIKRREAGKTIKLDATVKAHGEYKGVRETVLTRAKEV